jgi:hypothetical protein
MTLLTAQITRSSAPGQSVGGMNAAAPTDGFVRGWPPRISGYLTSAVDRDLHWTRVSADPLFAPGRYCW